MSIIERGPMGGDQFTQIANTLFRDPRLSAKAMGVFGHISTHRGGFGVTPEFIARHMRDGVSAIKGALQELEQFGYLVRARERRDDGTLGATRYWITDMPKLVDLNATDPPESEETSRSKPKVENQPLDVTCDNESFPSAQPKVENPTVDKPTVVNQPPKNTKKKNTTRENTTSSYAEPEPAVTPSPREEEEDGTTRAARELLSTLPDPWRLGPQATTRLAPLTARALHDGWDPDALANHLAANPHGVQHPERCLQARLNDLPAAPTTKARETPRPSHCGQCHETTRLRETDSGTPFRCPACHPSKVAA